MKNAPITLFFTLGCALISSAQVPTIQDCEGAIPVCQMVYTESAGYAGTGNFPTEINAINSCLGAGEINSVWYEMVITSSGDLAFDITPTITTSDYDFAVYDLTSATCADILTNPALEISCNYSGANGITGANGSPGAQNNPVISVTAGQNLVLVINNFSGTAVGYTLDFNASTANPLNGPFCNATCNDSTFAVSLAILDPSSCIGSCDASLIASVTGGAAPYTYAWSTGASGVGLDTLTGLCDGVYQVIIADAFGCLLTASYTVTSVNPFTVTSAIQQITCSGICDGEITVGVTGGSPPYTYSWVEGVTGAVVGNGPTLIDLCPDLFTVTITDTFGCNTSVTYQIIDAVPLALLNISTNDATCGACDGAAGWTIVGGIPPYTVSGTGTVTFSGATGLCAGSYNLTVSDANGCAALFNVPVNNVSADSMTVTATPDGCGSCTGTATVATTCGGCIINWFFGNGNPLGQTGLAVTGLCSGNYYVEMVNGSGCTATENFTVGIVGSLSVNSQITHTCGSSCDGGVTFGPSGGVAPYIFSIDNGATYQVSNTFANLCAGTYVSVVQDTMGCTVSNSIVVLSSTGLTIDSMTVNDATCLSSCDGYAAVFVGGGIAPYSYMWDNIAPASSAFDSSFCVGNHTVTITDAAGCTTDTSFTISAGPGLVVDSMTVLDASCPNSCDGAAAIYVSNGVPAHSYSWDSLPASASAFDNSLCAGTHTVSVIDAAGCTVDTSFVIGTLSTLAINSVASTPTVCNSSCSGTITLNATGASLTFSIDGVIYQSSNIFTAVCGGSYIVYVEDSLGCSDTTSVIVTGSGGGSTIPTAFGDTSICAGGCTQLFASGLGTYTWFPAVGLSDSTISNPTACPTATTTYCVTGTDSAGCPTDTACVTITVVPVPIFGVSPNVTISYPDSTIICASPATGSYIYLWSNGVNTACQTVSPDSTATYLVNITDLCGNSYADSVTVTVLGGIGYDELDESWLHFEIYPNPTMQNPTLALDITQVSKVKLRLTDVLGRTVYEPAAVNLAAGHHQLPILLGERASSGVYVLQMEINGAFYSTNIIKQ